LSREGLLAPGSQNLLGKVLTRLREDLLAGRE